MCFKIWYYTVQSESLSKEWREATTIFFQCPSVLFTSCSTFCEKNKCVSSLTCSSPIFSTLGRMKSAALVSFCKPHQPTHPGLPSPGPMSTSFHCRTSIFPQHFECCSVFSIYGLPMDFCHGRLIRALLLALSHIFFVKGQFRSQFQKLVNRRCSNLFGSHTMRPPRRSHRVARVASLLPHKVKAPPPFCKAQGAGSCSMATSKLIRSLCASCTYMYCQTPTNVTKSQGKIMEFTFPKPYLLDFYL